MIPDYDTISVETEIVGRNLKLYQSEYDEKFCTDDNSLWWCLGLNQRIRRIHLSDYPFLF